MKEKFWVFHEYVSGGCALFRTREQAEAFRIKMDIYLLQDPEIGEAMDKEEYEIFEAEVNPDFDTWITGG